MPAPLEKCRLCDSNNLVVVFNLGTQYVSDFVAEDKVYDGVKCPITVVQCRSCSLVQQRWTAPQELLYSGHYWYRSGTTETMRQALLDVVRKGIKLTDLKAGDAVLDIGANDGTLLSLVDSPGVFRIGVEPASNLFGTMRNHADVAINDFWPLKVPLRRWRIKLVTACGMFYDLDDPRPFVQAIQSVLVPGGVFIAQLMCLKQMLRLRDAGNLAHEHLEFYTLRSLTKLMIDAGLTIFDIEENNVNGGSYRLYCCHHGERGVSQRVVDAWASEFPLLDGENVCKEFSAMEAAKRDLVDFVTAERSKGKRIWVYGASTKGNVLLQWWGLDGKTIEAAADKSEEKHGKYTIGSGIPIKSLAEFREAKPDYAIILPYTFEREICEQEKVYLSSGGKFIVPIPEVKVIS